MKVTTEHEIPTLEEKIREWEKAVTAAQQWSEFELRLRNEIFSQAFPAPQQGTNYVRLGDGRELEATYKMNYTIDRPLLEASDISAELKAQVISYSPKVKDGAFKDLDMEAKKQFFGIITEKPAAPSIKVGLPKKRRAG